MQSLDKSDRQQGLKSRYRNPAPRDYECVALKLTLSPGTGADSRFRSTLFLFGIAVSLDSKRNGSCSLILNEISSSCFNSEVQFVMKVTLTLR